MTRKSQPGHRPHPALAEPSISWLGGGAPAKPALSARPDWTARPHAGARHGPPEPPLAFEPAANFLLLQTLIWWALCSALSNRSAAATVNLIPEREKVAW